MVAFLPPVIYNFLWVFLDCCFVVVKATVLGQSSRIICPVVVKVEPDEIHRLFKYRTAASRLSLADRTEEGIENDDSTILGN